MFVNRVFLLYGMGISLRSLAKYFHKNTVDFYISDKNPETLNQLNYKKFPDWNGCDALLQICIELGITDIVVAPGVNDVHGLLSVAKSINIWNDIILFLHSSSVDHILCTGTFGKSTCVSLVQFLYNSVSSAKIQLGGNIGIPVFDLDLDKIAVIEVSAQQLELFSYSSKSLLSILLNIYYPHHADRYRTRRDYESAKFNIVNNAQHILMNSDLTKSYESSFSDEDESAYFYFKDGYVYEDRKLIGYTSCNAAPISFIGAYAAIRRLFPDLDPSELLRYANGFNGLDYRCQTVLHDPKNSLWIVNDSKSTSLINSAHCIRKFGSKGKIGWIGGGKEQEQDLTRLDDSLQYISCAALTGSCANVLANYLHTKSIDNKVFGELNDCIEWLYENGCNVIVFSPGYASTDQYQNFEARGKYFNELVHVFRYRAD